jgi:cyclophilin family peptidyl-prolyl cis-trans isomerase
VERLKESKGDNCEKYAESNHDHQFVAMQGDIRRLNLAQTIARFGQTPVVQFWIRSPDRSADSFEVQIQIHDMPHTVYTFLTLVDAGLYHSTTIARNSDKDEIVGGSKSSGKNKSNLLRKYAEAGYGTHPLLFTEVSTADCNDDFSFGIVSRGPEFAIGNSLTSCFGRVTVGQDVLSTLESDESSAIIVDTRILRYRHDEL